jgi:hypothetical protein
MKGQWTWIGRRGVLLVLLGASLCWSGASINMSARERASVQGQRARAAAEQALANFRKPAVDAYMTDLSLAIREHDDFLLTPALLVQEAVSDDVILTYPEE